jgi:hypothetical protein
MKKVNTIYLLYLMLFALNINVFSQIIPPPPILPPCPNITTCNLICNGEIENTTNVLEYSYLNTNTPSTLYAHGNSSDIFTNISGTMTQYTNNWTGSGTVSSTTIGTIPSFNAKQGFGMIGIAQGRSHTPSFPNYHYKESIVLRLRKPLTINGTYTLKFWARKYAASEPNMTFKIYGSSSTPCTPTSRTLINGTVSACGYQTTQNWSQYIDASVWTEYSITITPTTAITNLLIEEIDIVPPSYIFFETHYCYFDDFRLSEGLPLAILISSAIDCTNNITSVTTSGGKPTYTYLWNDGSTLQNRTGLSTGTYSVTATDANNCTVSNSITVIQPPLPNSIGTSSIPPKPDVTSATPVITAAPVNKVINIFGNFTINTNITFTGCTIYLQEGSKIIINSGINLTLLNCTLKSCINKLWKGIEVQNNGNLTMSNTIIEDAHIAVEYLGNATTSLQANTFRNNVIGIYYTNQEIFSINKPLNLIKGNTFTGTAGVNLKSKYAGFISNTLYGVQSTQPTIITKPFAGIMVLDAIRFDIDNSTSDAPNIFSNMNNGIIAYNVKNAKINYGIYTNITSITGNTNLANGNGIYYKSSPNGNNTTGWSNLSINGLGKYNTVNSFNNCTRGVYAEGGAENNQLVAEIKNYYMTNVDYGIQLLNVYYPNISYNYISATKLGIHCNHNLICPTVTIANNDLVLTGTNSSHTGILIDDIYPYCNHELNTISNNCISTNGTTGFGIDVNNLRHLRRIDQTCNSISINNPNGSQGGIKNTNCFMSNITDNYISSYSRTASTSGDFPTAIHFNGSDNGIISFNQLYKIFTGLKYTGPCTKAMSGAGVGFSESQTFSNVLNELNTAMKFDLILNLNDFVNTTPVPTGTMTTYNMGNEFTGTITKRAYSPNINTPPRIFWTGVSKYNPCLSGSCDPISIGVSAVNSIWLPPWRASGTPICGLGVCGIGLSKLRLRDLTGVVAAAEVSGTVLRNAILTKSLDYAAYEPQLVWQMEISLYSKIKPYESTYADTSLEKLFIVEKDPEFYAIYELNRDANLMMNEDNTDIENYNNTYTNIQFTIDSLIIVRDTMTDSLSRVVINAQIEAEKASLNTVKLAMDPLLDAQREERYQYAETLKLRNDSLIAHGIADSLQKLYNSIFYDKYARGDYALTETQKATMHYIAHQCPFLNYDIVSRARSAYRIYDDSTYYNDSAICILVGIENKKADAAKPKEAKLRFDLYPNPARDFCALRFSEIPQQKLTIFVTDIAGRVYHNETLGFSSNLYELSTRNWTNGIYLIQIYEGKVKLSAQKLIVTH